MSNKRLEIHLWFGIMKHYYKFNKENKKKEKKGTRKY